jgi:uncharacterized protein (TIGR03435 family)
MPELTDHELLADFARSESEEAFATLAARYVNLVYSAALRFTGNAHHAEEITQAVFIILAHKAGNLSPKIVLPGWLYQTTRLTAANFMKAEIRRQRREQEAYMQSTLNDPDSAAWQQIAPLLEDAMGHLGETDRNAVVLRYFQNKTAAQVAATLNLTEAATHKRTSRALDKLRKFFSKHGVSSTTLIIAGAISAHSIQTAPAALAKSITSIAAVKGATASASTLTLIKGALKVMAWTNAKTATVIGAGILLITGTTTITLKKIEAHKLDEWRFQNVQPAQVDKASPQVEILPTKFPAPDFTVESGSHFDKFVGIRVPVEVIVGKAYGFPRGRIRFASEQPSALYDFAATLPQGSKEALQRELKKSLGFVGRAETTNTECMILTLKRANAPGLKPPILGRPDDYLNPGHFECFDQPIDTDSPPWQGLARFLEIYLGVPVVDKTGLTQHYSIDLKWKELGDRDPNHDALKRALIEQLGLELVPSREAIDILMVEKAKR